MIRTRVVALLAVAALGVGGGVATALVGDDSDRTGFADPLGLGIPKVDLDCTGEPVLVVANGDSSAALATALRNLPADERDRVRYLEVSESCDARWTAEASVADPDWVAYLGPGDRGELCLDRMTADHRGDNVTFLKAGSDTRAECLCEVPASAAPLLVPGLDSDTDAGTGIWIKALQSMFVIIDAARTRPDPAALTEDDVTGVYDDRTVARVIAFGEASTHPTEGVVDARTWKRLTDIGCKYYDYY